MPWIESHTEIERHRKVILMASELGILPVHLSGHLHAFWHNILEQQEDGNLERWPDKLIAQMAMWEGDVERFVGLLRQSHFIDGTIVHDWLDYAGKYLWRKYHTANPKKLQAIRRLHKVANRSPKIGLNDDKKVATRGFGWSGRSLKTSLREEKGEEGGVGGEDPSLPDWLTVEVWQSFVDFRIKIKQPLTAKAKILAVSRLVALYNSGHDPKDVIDQSILNNWRGLFEVKNRFARSSARIVFSKLSEPLPK